MIRVSDPYIQRLAEIESGWKGDAANPKSSAKGYFQFINSTGKEYGLVGDDFDHRGTFDKELPAVQKFTEKNKAFLAEALGREPSPGEMYLAHQQGAGGAVRLLANPKGRAVETVGADAIRLNGGSEEMTNEEFANQWIKKFEGGEEQPAAEQQTEAPKKISGIADIRSQYPQYDDMSDQQLADAMHKKYYSDLDPKAVYEKLGVQTAANQEQPAAAQVDDGLIDIEMPDGTLIEGVPAGVTKADLMAKLEKNGLSPKGITENTGFVGGVENLLEDEAGNLNYAGKVVEGITSDLSEGIKNLDKAANLGQAYMQGRTFGFGPKVLSAAVALPVKGVLEAGEAINNAAGGDYKAPTISDIYTSGVRGYQGNVEQAYKDNPVIAPIAEIAGGLRTGKDLAKTKSGKALSDRRRAAGWKQRAAQDAIVGETAYRTYKVGTAKPGEEGQELVSGLPIGGISGGILSLAGSGYSAVADKVGARRIQKSNPLARISEKLKEDYPDPAQLKTALEEVKNTPGMTIADLAGKRTTKLAQGAAQFPKGEARTEEFLEGRISGVSDRIQKNVNKFINPDKDYYGTLDEIIDKGREKAAPLYDKAFQRNKSIVSKEIDNILDTPAGRKALKDAARIMQNDRAMMGLPDKELKAIQRDLAEIGKMGEMDGPIASGLNLRTLDSVKKSMDQQVRMLQRAGADYEAGVIARQTSGLVRELDAADASKAYAKARAVSGDYITTSKAMEAGRDFMRMDADLISRQFQKFTPAEKQAYKAGVVRKLYDNISNVSSDNTNLYSRTFSPKIQTRLKSILSPAEFDDLSKSMKAEDRLYKFRYKVLGNSQTTPKALAAAEFNNAEQELIETAANQGFLAVGRKALLGTIRKTFSGMSDISAGKVADILYETDPAKKLSILTKLEKADDKKAIEAYYRLNDMARAIRQKKAPTGASGIVAGSLTE